MAAAVAGLDAVLAAFAPLLDALRAEYEVILDVFLKA